MPKKEFKVGETFQCGLVKLRVVKAERAGTCTGCDLHGLECCIASKSLLEVVTVLIEKIKPM